jgi:histidine phosphotransferase ChpT
MTMLAAGQDQHLSELVAARICHDLGSPVASLTALLPQAEDPAAREILDETARELRARLLLMGAVFGLPDELDWAGMARLLAGAPMAHRVAFSLPARAGALPAGLARLALAGLLVAAESLPRGGTVHASEPAPGMLALRPEGRDAAWSEVLLELLAGGSIEAALTHGPRRVLAPWLACLAAGAGHVLGLAMPAGPGVAVLTITPEA